MGTRFARSCESGVMFQRWATTWLCGEPVDRPERRTRGRATGIAASLNESGVDRMKDPLRLFLDRHHGAPRAVHLGGGHAPAERPVHPPGIRGWLARKAEHYQSRWHEARTGLTGKIHHLWDWLHKRTPPDEPLLASFRKAHRIEVLHPESFSPEEAHLLWEVYLDKRRRRHLPRLAANLVVAPLTVLLVPLPGPNLVGYWFAYRSIHHLLILYGLRKVRKKKLAVSFHPTNDDERNSIEKPASDLDRLPTVGNDGMASSEPPVDSVVGHLEPASVQVQHDS